MTDFYIYASSDFSNANEFQINLAETLQLKNGEYSMALKEISYISTVYTLLHSTFTVYEKSNFTIKQGDTNFQNNAVKYVAQEGFSEACIQLKVDANVDYQYETKNSRIWVPFDEEIQCESVTIYRIKCKHFTNTNELCKFLSKTVNKISK